MVPTLCESLESPSASACPLISTIGVIADIGSTLKLVVAVPVGRGRRILVTRRHGDDQSRMRGWLSAGRQEVVQVPNLSMMIYFANWWSTQLTFLR